MFLIINSMHSLYIELENRDNFMFWLLKLVFLHKKVKHKGVFLRIFLASKVDNTCEAITYKFLSKNIYLIMEFKHCISDNYIYI